MTKRRLTTREVAKRLGVCYQRVITRVKQGHFPNHARCECGHAILIPEEDIIAASQVAESVDKRRKK